MKLRKEFLISIVVLILAAVAGFFALASSSSPVPQQVGSTELYAKDIKIDDTDIRLVLNSVTLKDENGEWLSGEYHFSGVAYNGKSFEIKVDSMVPPEYDPNTENDPLLVLKDISGDGSPEIIVTVIKGNQAVAHEILWFDGEKLENVIEQDPITDDQESNIVFDDIWHENGYAYLTSHGGDSRYEARYEFDRGSLIKRGSVGIQIAADTGDPDDCRIYLTLGKEKNEVKKEDCDIWDENLKPYWLMLSENSLRAAANELLKYVPENDSAIDVIVDTYYDLTLHYGNASDNSIFDKSDKFDSHEFFQSLLPDTSSWENRAVMQNEAFKLAFFISQSPAASFDMPWPVGPAIGGSVVGKKLIDPDTALVYASYGSQGYLGPSARACKENGEHIDEFTFKKFGGQWRVWEIRENIDSWTTNNEGDTEEECKSINQNRIEKYKIGSF